ALESDSNMVPAPSSYLRWQGKLIPEWAIRLLVLALIAPVLCATIDGLARARRPGHRVARWTGWVLAACVPFVLAGLALLAGAAAAGPVGGGALVLDGPEAAVLTGLACLFLLSYSLLWRVGRRMWSGSVAVPEPANGRSRRRDLPDSAASPGAASALLLVLCV